MVNSVAFSPDGKCIISGSDNTEIHSGMLKLEKLLWNHWRATPVGVASSPDGKCITSGSDDQTICVWNAETGEVSVGPLEGRTGSVTSITFSPDGKHMVSGLIDQTIHVWDAETSEISVELLEGHTN